MKKIYIRTGRLGFLRIDSESTWGTAVKPKPYPSFWYKKPYGWKNFWQIWRLWKRYYLPE